MVRWLSAAALLGLLLAAAAVLLFPPAASGPDSAVGGGPAADLPRHASPPDGTAQASAASLREPPRTAPPVPAVPVVPYWERVKRDCPWPPTLDSWTEVSGECDAALMESPRFFTGWRRRLSLHDPEETRRAVVAALDDPQCRVPPGEERPDLYEACAAEALIRFAEMQHTCVNVLGRDWDLAERSSRNLMEWRILKTGDLQEHREPGREWTLDIRRTAVGVLPVLTGSPRRARLARRAAGSRGEPGTTTKALPPRAYPGTRAP